VRRQGCQRYYIKIKATAGNGNANGNGDGNREENAPPGMPALLHKDKATAGSGSGNGSGYANDNGNREDKGAGREGSASIWKRGRPTEASGLLAFAKNAQGESFAGTAKDPSRGK